MRRLRASTSRRRAAGERSASARPRRSGRSFAQGRQGGRDGAQGRRRAATSECWRTTCARRATASRRRTTASGRADVDVVVRASTRPSRPSCSTSYSSRGPGSSSPATAPSTPPARPRWPQGDAESFSSVEGVTDMAGRLGDPANAMVWGRDFACTDLAMSRADDDAQARAKARVQRGGRGDTAGRAGDGDGAEPDAARRRSLRGLGAGGEEPASACGAGRRRGDRPRWLVRGRPSS